MPDSPRSISILAAVLFALAASLFITSTVLASPPAPIDLTFTQPDGSTFIARQWGDALEHGLETLDGYTIVQQEDGWWVYALVESDGRLVPSTAGGSSLVVGRDLPDGLPLHLRPAVVEESFNAGPTAHAATFMPQRGEVSPRIGTQNLLVLLVYYTDHIPVVSTAAFQSEILRRQRQRAPVLPGNFL